MAKKSKIDPLLFKISAPQPSKGQIRKAQITETALRLLIERGVDGLSFEAIAGELKIRRSHVVYYFPAKEDLVLFIVSYEMAKAQEMVVQDVQQASGEDLLKRYIKANFSLFQTPEARAVMTTLIHYAVKNSKFTMVQKQIREAGRARVRRMIELMISSEKKETEVAHAAEMIHSLITGQVLYATTTVSAEDEKVLEEMCEWTVQTCLDLIKKL